MKTELTYKQTTELIDLGVPREKASGKGYFEGVAGYYSTFTLADLLEILPKVTECKYGTSPLVMTFGGSDSLSNIQEWFAYYDDMIDTYRYHAEELIDALYQLACWYYGQLPLN